MRNLLFILLFIPVVSCTTENNIEQSIETYRITQTITYNNINVDVVIDKPALNEVDVLLVFHGTVFYDFNLMTAANTTLDKFKSILDRNDIMIVSVAYPQENVLLGDSIIQCEAALLWLKNNASQELGINVNKIFLAGHSQGGYMVTRLNTMHQTNGVIANSPGPLNLIYRCQLEENGQIAFKYVSSENPNGSKNDIAGVLSPNGRILGMMPHPERAVNHFHNSNDGKLFFESLLTQLLG